MHRALEYTARLRLPADTSNEEINGYVTDVLASVRLHEQSELAIDTPAPLSGGQLKRVSLAAELIANPCVLFLDEVTSGLDAGTDRQMMQTFAELADSGKTVICVTHTLENIAACQLVTLLHRGRLAYFGPPGEVQAYFGIERLSDIYEVLETEAPEHWAAKFEASPLRQKYIVDRLSSAAKGGQNDGATQELIKSRAPRTNIWRQAKILTRRNVDLIFADKRNLAILLLQAPLIGAVLGMVFDTDKAQPALAATQGQVAFMLVLSAIWFGCLNSAREIVKELPVYLRERSVNLGLTPYILSKLLPLAALCLIQCSLLLLVVTSLLDMPDEFLSRLIILTASAFAASAMGLAISAFVDSNDKAIAMVPILLIPQVVLSNAIAKLSDINLLIAKISMISFWGYDAMKSTLSSESLAVKEMTGDLLIPVLGSYGKDLAVIIVMTIAFLACVVMGLKLKDRKN